MPCALRTRPTIVSSGAATSLARVARRGRLARFAHGDRGRIELPREPGLVSCLEHARLTQEGTDGVARKGADIEPMVRSLGVQLNGLVALPRKVLADDLDEPTIPRARRIGDDNAERRRILAAGAAEANSNCHGAFSCVACGETVGSSRLRRFRSAPTTKKNSVPNASPSCRAEIPSARLTRPSSSFSACP